MEIPQYANAKGGGKDRHEIRFLGIELKTLGKIMQKKLDKSNLCLQIDRQDLCMNCQDCWVRSRHRNWK